jgi:hypothetical protein
VPGRDQELPLIRAAGALLLLTFLLLAAPARAQQPDAPPSEPHVVQGYLDASVRLARVHGRTTPLVGVEAVLGIQNGWRFGGAGFSMLDRIDLEIPPPRQNLELHIGYGGLLLERSFQQGAVAQESAPQAGLVARLLIGGGNAELRDAATGSRLRSDNFFLLEPQVSLEAPLSGIVSGGAVAGYRFAVGVDGLQDIGESHLRGWSIGLLLRFGPF